MEKLQWFKFSPSDWMMGKIMRCDEITQARFLRLCCLYWNKECILTMEDAEIEIEKSSFDALMTRKVIREIDGMLCISFLDEQIGKISETSQKRRDAANVRWGKKDANVMQDNASALQNDAEERRGEKRREDKEIVPTAKAVDYPKLLEYINTTFTREFRIINDSIKTKYKARIKEGYTTKDIRTAIDNCRKDKYHIETNFKYCTPEFFSRSGTIDKYSSTTNGQTAIQPKKFETVADVKKLWEV